MSKAGLFVRILAVFLFLGPPIGGFVLFLVALGLAPFSFAEARSVLLLVMVLSYPFGVIPAALTGLICAFLASRKEALPSWAVAGAAAVSAAIYGTGLVLFTGLLPDPGPAGRPLMAFAYFGLPGLVAALVCGWIVRRRWFGRAASVRCLQ